MIHPFMPFISEELWQRLPRRPNDTTASIMIASYPQYIPELDDATANSDYELVLGCARRIRSLSSEESNKDGVQSKLTPPYTGFDRGITTNVIIQSSSSLTQTTAM